MCIGEVGNLRRAQIMQRPGPSTPPGCATVGSVTLIKSLEHCKIGERLSPLSLKFAECLTAATPRRPVRAKLTDPEAPEQHFQYRPLAGGDSAVINDRGGTRSGLGRREPCSPGKCARGFVISEAGHNRHVNVQIIEPASVRGRIGTDMQWLGREQRMQRVAAER